jgi:hypothetical protein
MTQIKTMNEILTSARKMSMMTKTATMAVPRFLHSSKPMTSSVSQAA